MDRILKPKSAPKKSTKKIEFEFFAPNAESVKVAGSFNNWNPEATVLKKSKDGKWKGSAKVESGRYEYRYLVDGLWENDQRPVECVPNSYGSWNCVLEVQ